MKSESISFEGSERCVDCSSKLTASCNFPFSEKEIHRQLLVKIYFHQRLSETDSVNELLIYGWNELSAQNCTRLVFGRMKQGADE